MIGQIQGWEWTGRLSRVCRTSLDQSDCAWWQKLSFAKKGRGNARLPPNTRAMIEMTSVVGYKNTRRIAELYKDHSYSALCLPQDKKKQGDSRKMTTTRAYCMACVCYVLKTPCRVYPLTSLHVPMFRVESLLPLLRSLFSDIVSFLGCTAFSPLNLV